MIGTYFFAGIFGAAAVIVIGVSLSVWAKKRKKEFSLPPEVSAQIEYMWRNHPNLLLNIEMIFRQWNEMIKEKMKEDEERNERIASNQKFESEHLSGITMPGTLTVALQGYIIKSLLIRHYPGERSMLMDALLLKICNKIVHTLDEDETDFILQIDRKLSVRLMDELMELDSDVKDGMTEINRILKKNNTDNSGATGE